MKTYRQTLIDTIFELASDEIENVNDAKSFAYMSIKELEESLERIEEYIKEND